MTAQEVIKQLKALGNEKVRAHNTKYGAGKNQFGVLHGDIRKLARKIKSDHELGLKLWKTGNVDAQLLAVLILQPKSLSARDLEKLVKSAAFAHVADWLHSYVVKVHPEKETLRQKWMTTNHPMAARFGWGLTAGRVTKDPNGLDLPALLDRIESEMAKADPLVQWTMNTTLAEIGIHHPKHRKRALAIGEKIGLYKDWPVSKGCTPPYAPIWINAMVKRRG
ncbi:MAG: DNA alkylation repair protein [Phycisphaerae bacterium]|nr:MAG: DNA alkylation repair protein [Planctomycetota bacterium]GJQ25861.1 MAG: DNA alkylation repair protein [Phycisphaerae bacterium]